jgi:hypothetical protein
MYRRCPQKIVWGIHKKKQKQGGAGQLVRAKDSIFNGKARAELPPPARRRPNDDSVAVNGSETI